MSASERAAASARLAAARTRLILDKPFIGVLLLHLPLAAADWCRTVATDARRIYYNPHYIARLDARGVQFLLAHQALHCALGHFARRGSRLQARWDAACDYAVNLLLVDEGLEPVPGALLDPALRGLSAEEIYPLVPGETERNFDLHLFERRGAPARARELAVTERSERMSEDGAALAGSGDALDSDAVSQARRSEAGTAAAAADADTLSSEELARRWEMRFALAAEQARHAGRLSAAWQRLLGTTLEPPLPWRALLARFLASHANEDYSFQRPARRESSFVLPRLRSESIDVHAVLDTSGSIGAPELDAFAAELDALKGQVRARVSVHACDRALDPAGPWVFEPWQPIALPPRLAGGGGTDFRPVFDWLHATGQRPDVLLYFTDGHGEFPNAPPAYPVAWLVKGNAPVPWGERIGFS